MIHIDEDTWLGDVDERAWFRLVEKRGGCRCCVSPPCSACTEPLTEDELNTVGYTYERAAMQGGIVQAKSAGGAL